MRAFVKEKIYGVENAENGKGGKIGKECLGKTLEKADTQADACKMPMWCSLLFLHECVLATRWGWLRLGRDSKHAIEPVVAVVDYFVGRIH